MVFAFALAWENRKLLIGEAAPEHQRRAILGVLPSREEVEEVKDLKTMALGPDSTLVAAEIRFVDGLTTDRHEEIVRELERDVQRKAPEAKNIYIEVS